MIDLREAPPLISTHRLPNKFLLMIVSAQPAIYTHLVNKNIIKLSNHNNIINII